MLHLEIQLAEHESAGAYQPVLVPLIKSVEDIRLNFMEPILVLDLLVDRLRNPARLTTPDGGGGLELGLRGRFRRGFSERGLLLRLLRPRVGLLRAQSRLRLLAADLVLLVLPETLGARLLN